MDNNQNPIPQPQPYTQPVQGYPQGGWPQAGYGAAQPGYPGYPGRAGGEQGDAPVYPGWPAQAGQPAYYVPAEPPAFAVKRKDPGRVAATRAVNIMCLLVLLQTAAAFVFELPLMFAAMSQGVVVDPNSRAADPIAYQLLVAAMVPLSTALPFLLYMIIARRSAVDYLRFEKVGFGTGLLCVLAGVGVVLLGNFPAILVQDFFSGFGYEPASALYPGEKSLPVFLLELASTAVLVPVMEEFAFRGVLLSRLKEYGVGFAVFASALIFSLAHMDFSNVIFAFIAGLVFGFLYVKTGNLWVGVFIHMLNNGFAVLDDYAEFFFGDSAAMISDLLFYGLIAVGLVCLIILLIARRDMFFPRKNEEQEAQPLPAPTPEAALPLRVGASLSAVAHSVLFWLLVAMMVGYTAYLFF